MLCDLLAERVNHGAKVRKKKSFPRGYTLGENLGKMLFLRKNYIFMGRFLFIHVILLHFMSLSVIRPLL